MRVDCSTTMSWRSPPAPRPQARRCWAPMPSRRPPVTRSTVSASRGVTTPRTTGCDCRVDFAAWHCRPSKQCRSRARWRCSSTPKTPTCRSTSCSPTVPRWQPPTPARRCPSRCPTNRFGGVVRGGSSPRRSVSQQPWRSASSSSARPAVEQPSAADPGWVAVPVAPPNTVAVPARKVVAVPSPRTAQPEPLSSYYPAPPAATVPAAQVAPGSAAVTAAEPQGQPVLSGMQPEGVPHLGAQQPEAVPQLGAPQAEAVPHHGGPQPEVAPHLGATEPQAVSAPENAGPALAAPADTTTEPVSAPHVAEPMSPHAPGPSTLAAGEASAPEMTDSVNLFTALP